MRVCLTRAALVVLALPAVAHAQVGDDGYCDYVEGTASAASATQVAPELFGQFGYIEQPTFAVAPGVSNLRAIAGLRYSFTGLWAGMATRSRASADCRRHRALLEVRGASEARALTAKAKVLDTALGEADKMMSEVEGDYQAHRTTAQEATATRLRVEELRTLTVDAHRQLAALPPPGDKPLGTVMHAFHTADADMEDSEATLRRAQAFDLSVRAGVDEFLEGTNPGSQYFAVVQLGVNVGALWQGSGNARAAAGRRAYVRSGHDPLGADTTVAQLRDTIDLEGKRAEQTTALVADLDRQLQALAKVGGEDSKRYRQTVWFDWVKARADLAYLQAHVAGLREVVGGVE